MDTSAYITLSRQSGLMNEMQIIANNIANSNTTGFRREGAIFAEHVVALENAPSASVSYARARNIDLSPGDLVQTGGDLDLSIIGEGFFQVDTPHGPRLTRAGHFVVSSDGELISPTGDSLLDIGGTPITVPPDSTSLHVGQDGTISSDLGPFAVIGIWLPSNLESLIHHGGTFFSTSGTLNAANDSAKLRQGALESSNVNPIAEISRMISVQRMYEFGQSVMEKEDSRLANLIRTLA